ncbi:MAG TPA: hypothetical protein VKG63_19555 [Steroidobacteraceae bacterium]|nr:hypothetical protein [Steroidobacteraceae bacterium]
MGSIVAMAALLWPALYNGQPLFFPDTITYLRGADAGLQKLTGHSSPWTRLEDDVSAEAQTPPGEVAATPSVSSIKDKTVLSGRSVYYGAFLYLGDRFGHFWFTVLAQAALLMLAMGLFFKAFRIAVWPQLAIAGVVMGILTSASFYVSFLMPDVFAAVTLLGCASLIGARSLGRADYCLWTALLAFSLVSHASHVLIAAALLSLALLIDVLQRSWANWRGLAVIAGCLVLAGAAEAAFNMAVTHLVGAPPLRPPFLMAHAIEDGPGYRYLRDTCPASGFKVCEFLPRLPMPADKFIWSRNPPGVFAPASAEVRRELSAEQYRFVWAVLRHDPMGVASASINDVLRLIALMGLDEFNAPGYHDVSAAKLPVDYRPAFRASAAYRGAMPTRTASIIQLVTFGAGAAALLAVLTAARLRRQFEREQLRMLALLATGLVLNAAICGILSGPNGDRYATRVAWLIPFAALTAGFAVMQRRRGRLVSSP